MAKTRAINFLFDFYSDIGSTAPPSAFLFRAGPDLENFAQNRQSAVFVYKEASLSTPPFRVEHRSVIKI